MINFIIQCIDNFDCLLKLLWKWKKIKIELEQTLSGLKDMVRGELEFSIPERINKREDFLKIIGNSIEIEKVLNLFGW